MDKLELVRAAIQVLGDVSAQDLVAHVERQHGVKIDPKFIPVFKASLRDRLRRDVGREAARKALEQVKVEAV